MKRKFCLTLVLSALTSANPLFALDFTLRQQSVESEGLSLSASYITDGENKIMLRIPKAWKVSDSTTELDLLPTQASSKVSLTQVKTAPTLPLDAGGKVALLKEAAAQLPGGAKKVELLPEVTDLLPINGWTSVEFTHRYEYFGQTMRRSVVYINMLPGRVVQMSVTAPDISFDDVHEQARVLMSHWFEPRRELSPELAREYEEGIPHGT